MSLVCPFCYSLNTVKVWEGDAKEGRPDFVGCYDCDADMVDLREVEERLRKEVEGTA